MSKNNLGSNFDDFLSEESILDEATATAAKRVIAWHLEQAMSEQHISKTAMAAKLHTSRSVLDRLLDISDTSVTLVTLVKVASVLGKKLKIDLEPA